MHEIRSFRNAHNRDVKTVVLLLKSPVPLLTSSNSDLLRIGLDDERVALVGVGSQLDVVGRDADDDVDDDVFEMRRFERIF